MRPSAPDTWPTGCAMRDRSSKLRCDFVLDRGPFVVIFEHIVLRELG